GVGTEDGSSGEFGANEWLVDELYEQFVHDKESVDKSWWPILENYHPAVKDEAAGNADSTPSPSETPAPSPSEPGIPSPSEPVAPTPAEPTAPTPSEPTTQAPAQGGAPAP